MIKKPTLIVLLGALILGASVYYFDWKRGLKEKSKGAEDTGRPAFTIASAADIKSITLWRPADPSQPGVHLEKRGDTWEILQPLHTDADQQSLEFMTTALAGARLESSEPGTPDRMKAFGLDPPAVSLEFQLANGAKHTLKLGAKDFTGMSVYAIADGAKDVGLAPQSLLFTTAKSFDQLRDLRVLRIAAADVASFELKNPSGQLAAAKDKNDWKFTKPTSSLGDATTVNAVMTGLANARIATIASETPDDLAKYGLANPAFTFVVFDAHGKSSTLLVGKKEGEEYFARDVSRPMIFRINQVAYKQLTQNFAELRDKKVVHFDPAEVSRIELHNANGTMVCTRKSEEEWTIEAPPDQKGKSAGAWKILSPLTTARAEEVIDHPSPDVLARLAKPAIEAAFTDKSGKKLTVRFTKISSDFVYAQASDSPEVYKLRKQVSEDLSFKPSDLAF